ncbi:uncharacterized protein [Penaeus vannamei]|uniref:uncharacterized protein n=1 Tax=Penaeus vannamei TaxID=6689 RepID=UPI000F65F1FB|nr:uncharacterized protein LOC113818355 [Penaeus vannamei]XP_027226359.1 uncharacterized protein LOC113818355 [Penaeus vannamei]XP_027226360.1 uncharacterized protein LOC113818355 [Penaeus vannamei]
MLLKSKHASQVRGLLQDLDYDDLNSIVSASTNGKIEATTKKEAIDIILMNTSDLGRFFAYRRITCDVLFKYLNKLQAKNKKIELPMRTRKAEMILIIKDFWVKCVNKNRQKRKKYKKRKNSPKLPIGPASQKQKENDLVNDIKQIEINVSIASQSEIFSQKQFVEQEERNDTKYNCPTKNKCRRNLRSVSHAAAKLDFGLKETFKDKADSHLKSEFVGALSIQQSVSILHALR